MGWRRGGGGLSHLKKYWIKRLRVCVFIKIEKEQFVYCSSIFSLDLKIEMKINTQLKLHETTLCNLQMCQGGATDVTSPPSAD